MEQIYNTAPPFVKCLDEKNCKKDKYFNLLFV